MTYPRPHSASVLTEWLDKVLDEFQRSFEEFPNHFEHHSRRDEIENSLGSMEWHPRTETFVARYDHQNPKQQGGSQQEHRESCTIFRLICNDIGKVLSSQYSIRVAEDDVLNIFLSAVYFFCKSRLMYFPQFTVAGGIFRLVDDR